VPGVDSALVYFDRIRFGDDELRRATFEVIDAGFGQRRKTLRQSLAGWAGSAARAEQLLVAAGVNPQARAENLTVDDYVRIAEASR
jgi:16S rRNA (adenine1518-N6/adenine1519-N6)-dimethyltransferase